jgi:DNA-directed RNA polymerase subunit H
LAKKTKKSSKKSAKEHIDVLSYHLLPKMVILNEAEKNRILKKFGVGPGQLPLFRKNDPAVVALGAKPGDIIKIERDDGTGKYIAYRAVAPK